MTAHCGDPSAGPPPVQLLPAWAAALASPPAGEAAAGAVPFGSQPRRRNGATQTGAPRAPRYAASPVPSVGGLCPLLLPNGGGGGGAGAGGGFRPPVPLRAPACPLRSGSPPAPAAAQPQRPPLPSPGQPAPPLREGEERAAHEAGSSASPLSIASSRAALLQRNGGAEPPPPQQQQQQQQRAPAPPPRLPPVAPLQPGAQLHPVLPAAAVPRGGAPPPLQRVASSLQNESFASSTFSRRAVMSPSQRLGAAMGLGDGVGVVSFGPAGAISPKGVIPRRFHSNPASPLTAEPPDAGRQREELPLRVKLVMGLGESVQAIYVIVAGFYLNAFFLEVACLPANSVGAIQAISGLWDSVNDPMVGRLSDSTRSRWGRRRPWLLFSAVPLGLVFFAVFNAVPDLSPAVRFFYYLVAYMGCSIGITCIQVQIGSLTPELTDDYDERTSLATYRLGIGNVIAFAMLMAHSQTVGYFTDGGDARSGYRISGAFCGAVMACNALATFACIREKYVPPSHADAAKIGCLAGLRAVFQNSAFIYVVCMYLCGPVGIVLVQANLLMYCKYVIGDHGMFDYLVAVVFGTAMIFCPLWSIFAQRRGKKTAYYCGVLVTGSSVFCLYFLNDSAAGRIAVLVLAFLAGSGLIVPYLIPYSMLPDVIEEDELRTGQRREGIFFGFFTIFLKLAVTAALALTNVVLGAAGYEEPKSTCGSTNSTADRLPDTQPERVVNVLRLLVGPVPCIFFAIALFCAWKYPITRECHEAMLEQLAAKREDIRRRHRGAVRAWLLLSARRRRKGAALALDQRTAERVADFAG
eukprot:TRINITY_DN25849_c4_g1_i2.p1 TRINITY_DN25849_c4_g1~~TRINITY_DN25849_c4_g1_i2.p1  ORF type:complete len:806 (+),score=202.01 TRINITY_DN25849_c4_g1_i2:92-2509(+)